MHVSDMEIVRVHRHFRNIKEEERYKEEETSTSGLML
jgi:hypothetical protein